MTLADLGYTGLSVAGFLTLLVVISWTGRRLRLDAARLIARQDARRDFVKKRAAWTAEEK